MARQWLPEFFAHVEIDPQTLHARRKIPTIEVEVSEPELDPDDREYEALTLLESEKPRHRVRGLRILAELEDPDLFEWCVMYLEDDSAEVCAAALKAALHCEDADPDVIAPYAESEDKHVRASAIAALARHSGEDSSQWFRRGLEDPYPNVRLETAVLLPLLDPVQHRAVFELALYDPNPHIRRRAERLTAGKGYRKLKW
jgi:HEAT repeat protein